MSVAAAPSRAVLRQSRALLRRPVNRQSSTASDSVAAKSKEAAAKASQGLSKAVSTASPAISGAVQGVASALRKMGGRSAKFVGFVERMIPPTIYYSRVGLELSKIVFRGQKMSPPSSATFQQYFSPILSALRQPSTLTSKLCGLSSSVSLRNMDRKAWAFVGVTAAEVLGFFSVGEMIGRMKIVGYRGDVAHNEH